MNTMILLAALVSTPVEEPLRNWVCAVFGEGATTEVRCHDREGTPGNVWTMHPAFFIKDAINIRS